MLSQGFLLGAAIAIPLAAAPLIALAGESRANLREAISIIASILLLAVLLALLPEVQGGARPVLILAEPFPGLPLALRLEPLGMMFALIAAFLWLVTTVYAIGYMRGHHEEHQTRFYFFFAVAIAVTQGVALSGNLLTLFVFYEALTLSTYPLVTHHGDEAARKGGRVYLGILLFTSITFLLLAMVWTWSLAGTLVFRTGGILAGTAPPGVLGALLALYFFGVGKAALMPFHRWLPAAMVAPTPVSALLHAVAVVKAGVFTLLKVSLYTFGPDLISQLPAARWLAYVAAASIVIASLIAMRQDNLKARLAYSTVSQLGYITLGALLAAAGTVAGALHIVMHAFAKITLFFGAGAVLVAAHRTQVSQLDGLGRRMPITFGAFTLASFSIVGLPPLGGAWSKWYLGSAALTGGDLILFAALMLSSLLSLGYLLPICARAFFAPPQGAEEGVHEAPLACAIAMVVTALACIVLFIAPQPWFRLAAQAVGGQP